MVGKEKYYCVDVGETDEHERHPEYESLLEMVPLTYLLSQIVSLFADSRK